MYIPLSSLAPDGPYDRILRSIAEDGSSDSPAKKWSSTIGIVTAIVGNVLISFALNTQRYAHMRIAKERDAKEEKIRLERKKRKRKPTGNKGYGTQQQIEAAEDREIANVEPDPVKYSYKDPQESDEREPLIPRLDDSGRRKDSRRQSEDDEEEPDLDEDGNVKEKSYLKSPIWWAGITMMTLGETGNFLAYGFAPSSIVAPLGVVALISNCLIAPWLLRERFRWRDGIGVVIAVAGCVTVVLSASSSNPKLDPDSIWQLITTWEFETYLGITVILISALCVASNKFGEKSILIDLGLMGLFGGYTALSTKGVASLLSTSIWRVITFPITYLLVAVLVFTAVMQIKYVNRALQRFDSTQVIPTQFVLFTLSVIIGSAILYRDFERTTTDQAIKFVGGCALTFLGVWCITSGRHDSSQDDEEDVEAEDAVDLVDEEGVQPEIRERDDDANRRRSLIHSSSQASSSKIALDDSVLTDAAVDIPPANAAAIHSDSMTSLPEAEVEEVRQTSKKQPPPMHATTSEPVVPRLERSLPSTPKTPIRRGYSVFEPSPTKDNPATAGDRQNLEPSDSNALLSKRSYAGLLPSHLNPLTSPLSSSLSAIVADSLRRGVDSSRRHSKQLKRKLNNGGVGSAADAAPLKRHSIASGEMEFGEEGDDEDVASPTRGQGRIRSLSATLGDLFGSSSQKRRRMGSRDDVMAQQEQSEGTGGGNASNTGSQAG